MAILVRLMPSLRCHNNVMAFFKTNYIKEPIRRIESVFATVKYVGFGNNF